MSLGNVTCLLLLSEIVSVFLSLDFGLVTWLVLTKRMWQKWSLTHFRTWTSWGLCWPSWHAALRPPCEEANLAYSRMKGMKKDRGTQCSASTNCQSWACGCLGPSNTAYLPAESNSWSEPRVHQCNTLGHPTGTRWIIEKCCLQPFKF